LHQAGDLEEARNQNVLDRVTDALGPAFLRMLENEAGGGLWNHNDDSMFRSMVNDLAGMAKPLREAAAPALVARLSPTPADLPQRPITDSHYHHTGYSGNVTSLEENLRYADDNAMVATIAAGIPSQMWGQTSKALYYNNNPHKISMAYRDHDRAAATDYTRLPPESQKRIVLCITGIDITNVAIVGKELDQRLREFPRVFKGSGEDTWWKEIVSKSQLHVPTEGDITAIIKEHLVRWLPFLLHCDRGEASDKSKFSDAAVRVLAKVPSLVEDWAASDPLRRKEGLENAPPPGAAMVWAHGMGLRRYGSESRDHTRFMMQTLDAFNRVETDKGRRSKVHWDASWDFVTHNILE